MTTLSPDRGPAFDAFHLFRRPNGTINLHQAWRTTTDPSLQRYPTQRVQAAQFFHQIEAHQLIQSTEVAALALATCQFLITTEKLENPQ